VTYLAISHAKTTIGAVVACLGAIVGAIRERSLAYLFALGMPTVVKRARRRAPALSTCAGTHVAACKALLTFRWTAEVIFADVQGARDLNDMVTSWHLFSDHLLTN
jgi:hypothetical protein